MPLSQIREDQVDLFASRLEDVVGEVFRPPADLLSISSFHGASVRPHVSPRDAEKQLGDFSTYKPPNAKATISLGWPSAVAISPSAWSLARVTVASLITLCLKRAAATAL